MKEIYQDNEEIVYAVMRDDNYLMSIDEDFLMPEDYRYADYRTSPTHWQRYGIPIPPNCRVVKVYRSVIVSISEI